MFEQQCSCYHHPHISLAITSLDSEMFMQIYSCYCQPCVSLPPSPPDTAKSASAGAQIGVVTIASIVTVLVLLTATASAVAYRIKQDSKLTKVSHACCAVTYSQATRRNSVHQPALIDLAKPSGQHMRSGKIASHPKATHQIV